MKRYNLSLDDKTFSDLQWIAEETNTSWLGIIRKAIRVLRYIMQMEKEGYKIHIVSKDEKIELKIL